MEKDNDKMLFTVDIKPTSENCYNMLKHSRKINKKFRKRFIIFSLLFILIAFSGIINNPSILSISSILYSGVAAIIYTVVAYFINKSVKNSYITKLAKFLEESNELNYTIDFYEDYLIFKNDRMTLKIKYSEINKATETDGIFFLFYGEINISIYEEACSAELITFIRNHIVTMPNIESNHSNIKKSRIKNPTNIKKSRIKNPNQLLSILFIATIISFLLAPGLFSAVINYFNIPSVLQQKYSWVFLLMLPIPIISILVGTKYSNRGYDCKKNVIAGWIIVVLLFLYSFISLAPPIKQEYSNIMKYKDIVNVDIPNSGKFYVTEYTQSYLLNHKSIYAIFTNEEEANKFEVNINNNSNWILKNNINYDLEKILPIELPIKCGLISKPKSQTSCKYLTYIKETNEYNTVPSEQGQYQVYFMVYNSDTNFLDIEEYQINF